MRNNALIRYFVVVCEPLIRDITRLQRTPAIIMKNHLFAKYINEEFMQIPVVF